MTTVPLALTGAQLRMLWVALATMPGRARNLEAVVSLRQRIEAANEQLPPEERAEIGPAGAARKQERIAARQARRAQPTPRGES